MRIKWLVIFALGIILTSCNLPLSSTPTSSVDVLSTQVSIKLTQTAAAGVQPGPGTIGPRPTNTPVPGGATTRTGTPQTASLPSPTGTGAPSATLTRTGTSSASSTSTPTRSPTPTAIPGDPRTTLGTPVWKETFQKPTTWGLDAPYDDGHTRVSIDPGKILLKSFDSNGWHGWRMMTNPKIQNFYLETTITTQTCSGADLFGLVFRANNEFQGYWFGVTCDGRYNLTSGDIYNETELIKAKASPLIKAGSGQTNRLGVVAKDKKITLYMNGKLLDEVTSDAYSSAGTFGYFIAAYKTPGFTYESTEIAYWNLQ